MLSVADIQTISDIAKNQRKICDNVNYKLPCNIKARNVIAYKHYFIDFVKSLSEKMQDKVVKAIQYVETLQIVPEKYLKHIEGTKGLYEIRVKFSSDIIRIFCFFDGERMVILLSGFQKKTQKTQKKR